MFSPLSTEYPQAGGLISNSIARSPSDMPCSFTAQYHKLFSFTYITYFFASVPIPYSQRSLTPCLCFCRLRDSPCSTFYLCSTAIFSRYAGAFALVILDNFRIRSNGTGLIPKVSLISSIIEIQSWPVISASASAL